MFCRRHRRTESKRARADSGLALLELTTAITVLMVGMFGVIEMYHFSTAKLRALTESRIALQAVQNEVETLRALPFDALQNGEAVAFRSETPTLESLMDAVSVVTIRDHDRAEKHLKEVRVAVTWRGENGRTITKRVATLIADKERR